MSLPNVPYKDEIYCLYVASTIKVMMVDKKHGDIVLKINVANVGTRRVRYSYQPKECRRKKKTAQLTQSQSQESEP